VAGGLPGGTADLHAGATPNVEQDIGTESDNNDRYNEVLLTH
jgi:hypothetical protein